MSETTSDTWLTVREAAAHAKVGIKTIYREASANRPSANRLQVARVGGRRELRFRKEWIDAWLDASASPPKAA